jgi:antitoxin HigA-1
LKPLGLSAHALAKAPGLAPSGINDIVVEHRGINAAKAVRPAPYFAGDAKFWLILVATY